MGEDQFWGKKSKNSVLSCLLDVQVEMQSSQGKREGLEK